MNAERRTEPQAPEHEQDERQGPVVRDKRRIDPETGAVREPVAGTGTGTGHPPGGPSGGAGPQPSEEPAAFQPDGEAAGAPGDEDEIESLRVQLAERTADLQRVQAEYANYRKRVERDRGAVREQALANVLTDLLPVLDDIERARQHGELNGGFQKVAESFEAIVTKLGLTRFGEKGEPFDPTVHEALMHQYSHEVTEPSCVEILQPGYAVAGRVLRPARVTVAEPSEATGPGGSTDTGTAKGDGGSGEPAEQEGAQAAKPGEDAPDGEDGAGPAGGGRT